MEESGLMQPGPTLARAAEKRKDAGSQGLLAAIGEPVSYSPNPILAALGQLLLLAQYATGEKSLKEGLSAGATATAIANGLKTPPALLKAIRAYHGTPQDFEGKPNPPTFLTTSPWGAKSYATKLRGMPGYKAGKIQAYDVDETKLLDEDAGADLVRKLYGSDDEILMGWFDPKPLAEALTAMQKGGIKHWDQNQWTGDLIPAMLVTDPSILTRVK